MRMPNKMHTFSHLFIPIKLPSTCFEQIIVHHQEVVSVHAAYNILPCIYGCLTANTMWLIPIISYYLYYTTGLFKMTVGVLTTCHTQYTWDRSICIFLFNRTTLQVFVKYLTGVLWEFLDPSVQLHTPISSVLCMTSC